MTEIDKLIKAIDIHYGDGSCKECPYYSLEGCGIKIWELIKNELLKRKSEDSLDNVFVMRANAFLSDDIIKGLLSKSGLYESEG